MWRPKVGDWIRVRRVHGGFMDGHPLPPSIQIGQTGQVLPTIPFGCSDACDADCAWGDQTVQMTTGMAMGWHVRDLAPMACRRRELQPRGK